MGYFPGYDAEEDHSKSGKTHEQVMREFRQRQREQSGDRKERLEEHAVKNAISMRDDWTLAVWIDEQLQEAYQRGYSDACDLAHKML